MKQYLGTIFVVVLFLTLTLCSGKTTPPTIRPIFRVVQEAADCYVTHNNGSAGNLDDILPFFAQKGSVALLPVNPFTGKVGVTGISEKEAKAILARTFPYEDGQVYYACCRNGAF